MILLLGGTTEGRRLAELLDEAHVPYVLSLAGRTSNPIVRGTVRTGGFGGADGLAAYLIGSAIEVVVDATHPFARTMSTNAAAACHQAGIPLVRLDRPGWSTHPLAHTWTWVDDHAAAAAAVLLLGASRVLLTVGRLHTLDYSPALDQLAVLARVAEPPSGDLPPTWRLLQARGPFTIQGEGHLLRSHRIDTLVTKDSGGEATAAKLAAAAEAGVRVVMVRRAGRGNGEAVDSVEAALAALAKFHPHVTQKSQGTL